MPNPGENSAGFQEGAAYQFTQNPNSNPRGVPLSLQTSSVEQTNESAGKSSLVSPSSSIPISPPMSMPLTQPKGYQVDLSESLGVGDTLGGAATQTVLKPQAPTQTNPIIGYKAGITSTGVRYQTPIYETEQQPPKPDVPDPFSSGSTKSLIDTIGTESGIKQGQSINPANFGGTPFSIKGGLLSTSNPQNTLIGIPNGKQNAILITSSNPEEINSLKSIAGYFQTNQGKLSGVDIMSDTGKLIRTVPINQKGYDIAVQILREGNPITFGPSLIDLQKNYVIKSSNNDMEVNNAIDKLANQDSIAKAQLNLKQIVAGGLLGNAKEFDIYNSSGAKVGSIPANANSYNSLSTLLDIGEPLSIRSVNPLAEQTAKANAASNIASLKAYIGTAKTEGVKSLNILGPSAIGGAFGSQGAKIGTTTPDDALRDILAYPSKGTPISLSYQPVVKAVPGPFDSIKTSITNSPVGQEAKGLYKGFGITSEQFPEQSKFTGVPSSIPGGSSNVISSLASFGTAKYQPSTPQNQGFFNENLPNLIARNPAYALSGLAGAGIGIGLTLGLPEAGQVTKIPGLISDLLKSGASKGIVSDIAKAASKGEATIAPQIEKASPDVFHITLGTEGRSITPTQKFQKLIDIFRLPTSKEVPGFGTVATQEGKVGANEVKLPKITQEIGNLQGESAISDIYVQPGKSGITAIIPKDINTDVKETSFLINDLSPIMQTRLGAKPVEGLEGYFTGKLTPETRLILKQAEDSGLVTKEKQAFQFPTVDVKQSPDLYVSIAKNPSLLGETGTAATEKIFPDITRPDVLGIYRTESKGFESAKGKVSYLGEPYGSKGEDYFLNNYANVNFKPVINPESGKLEEIRGLASETKERTSTRNKKSTPFSFEQIGKSSIGAGASGKANALDLQVKNENIIKDFYKSNVKTEEKKLGDYLGFSPRQTGRARQTEETEILSFPPGTKSELAGKQIGIQGIKLTNDILQGTKEKQVRAERAGTLYKLGSELKQNQNSKLDQSLRFALGNIQTARTGLLQNPEQITSLAQLTRQNTGQTPRTGLLQNPEQITNPLQTTRLLLVPLLITIPTNTPKPPKIGGGFNFPQFNFTYSSEGGPKQKKTGFRKSFIAYSVNPNIVGSIEQAGLPGLQVGKSAVLYGDVDKQLAKATRLQYKGTKLRF